MRSFAAAAALFVPLALVSCTEETAGPLSEKRQPASISISAADVQLDDGDTLQVFANLLDQHDNVFSALPEGVVISWSSEDESIVEVAPDGRLIGNSPGTTTIRATADGHEAEATVGVRAVAKEVVLIEGESQDGLPNSALPDSVVLRVIDRHGDGVAGAEVRFRVTSGGGSIAPASVVSDAQGLVRVQWTLGPVIGAQAMEAFAPGAGQAVAVDATISSVIFGGVDVATEVTQGAALPVTIRIDTNLYPVAVGGAHLVVSWDPAKLALAGAVGVGDYARMRSHLDAAAGQLHLLGTDPVMTRGDMTAAELTFDVIGGAGTSATVSLAIEQLVGIDFLDASAAGIGDAVAVTIN